MSFQGTVKSFNPMKGFGFADPADGSGVDIFLHINNCKDGGTPQIGDVLSFDVEPSKSKPGQMVANNISGGTGAPADGQQMQMQKGGGKGGMMGGSKGGMMGYGMGGGCMGAQGTGANQGTVKSFNAEKGFGFIQAADGTDVFFHFKGMVDGSTPQTGDVLSFDVEPSRSKPGQMVANNITGGTGMPSMGGMGGMMGGMDGGYGGGYGKGGMTGGGMMGGCPYGGGGAKGGPINLSGGKGGWGGGW